MAQGKHDTAKVERIDGGEGGKDLQAVCSGLVIRRDRLVRQIMFALDERGICLIAAPAGFGRTAILLQCVSDARNDAAHGEAHLIEAGRMGAKALMGRLELLAGSSPSGARPVVAIDDIPRLDREAAERLAGAFRALLERGYEVLAVCKPICRTLISACPEARMITASDLAVQPREYSEWARLYSISRSLDVYELTWGIPSLVTTLQFATDRARGGEMLERAVARLDRQVLADLRRERDTLYRPACLMLLMGSGSIGDLERCGPKLHRETAERLARDYPLFGLDVSRGAFSCLGHEGEQADGLKRDIAKRRPVFAMKATRALMHAGRVDAAVDLADLVLDDKGKLELISMFPTQCALAGQAQFVQRAVAPSERAITADTDTGLLVAIYASALTLGDFRRARRCATELGRRGDAIARDVDARSWECACEIAGTWGSVNGIALPEVFGMEPGEPDTAELMLRAHRDIYHELVAGAGCPVWDKADRLMRAPTSPNALDIPSLLLISDRCLDRALHADGPVETELERLEAAAELSKGRRLVAVATRLRLVVGICRLYAGGPVVDERCFAEAGTMAVRESDLPTQLLCLAAEGWQALATGQAINAHFRGQQVLKLAPADHGFLRFWGYMLERSAYLTRASRARIREEAEAFDLSKKGCTSAEAWGVAMHLAAARLDSELSAWYSRHKGKMLDARLIPTVRHALAVLGGRMEPLRHLLPSEVVNPVADTVHTVPSESIFEVIEGGRREAGEVVINLFGGFHAERNGHVLTDALWRRKKAAVLAAHLALAMGSFVSRRTIIDELWPDAEYARGRESLYVTLSSLRAAMKQHQGGPQYVLTQGNGVALNSEFVYSDVRQFDTLARSVLLSQESATAQQVIDACLKIEQLYRGPLYVPDSGDPTFFVEMRRTFLTKFIDCMVNGVDTALQADNVSCASWLIEAALKQAPTREDVIRRAMTVYDRCGRRREVVELYNAHLHYLQREVDELPEEETREIYDRIINRQRQVAML